VKWERTGARQTVRVDHPSGQLSATYSAYEQEHKGRRSWVVWLLIRPDQPREIGRQFAWLDVEALVERSWLAECSRRNLDVGMSAGELSGGDVDAADYTPPLHLRRVWTGYFGRHKAMTGVVGIAVGPPRWFTGPTYLPLAPTRPMLRMREEEYRVKFDEILAGLHPQKVVDDLYEITQGAEPIMLCWEKPSDYCHRQTVAAWLERARVATVREHPGPGKPTALEPDRPLF
jgi:hypothetical protein